MSVQFYRQLSKKKKMKKKENESFEPVRVLKQMERELQRVKLMVTYNTAQQ